MLGPCYQGRERLLGVVNIYLKFHGMCALFIKMLWLILIYLKHDYLVLSYFIFIVFYSKLYFTDLGVEEFDLGPLARRKRAASDPDPKIAIATLDGSLEMTVFSGPNVSHPTDIVVNPRIG